MVFFQIPKGRSTQTGFTLITALFLIIVVALLSLYMVNFRTIQQSTVVFGLQGARAMQAVQAGLEWGIYDSITNGNCAASAFTATGAALNAFTINTSCALSTHLEGVTPINTYRLTSTAQTGTYGTLDYVYRSMQATVSIQPP